MRVLIVDDSRAMRMIVRRTLRQAGYGHHTFDEAVDGAEALAMIRKAAPDLVLADWNMPVMNGLELLQILKKDGCNVPFGFVTSEGTPEMRTLASQHGANFLIAKPFTVAGFQLVLDAFLR
jgi:two-component system chemotaxis response regulator CheY